MYSAQKDPHPISESALVVSVTTRVRIGEVFFSELRSELSRWTSTNGACGNEMSLTSLASKVHIQPGLQQHLKDESEDKRFFFNSG